MDLHRALGETEFSEALMGTLRSEYRPGVGMADAFAKWLETLLGPYGLVVYDSSDPAAKPLVADLFAFLRVVRVNEQQRTGGIAQVGIGSAGIGEAGQRVLHNGARVSF